MRSSRLERETVLSMFFYPHSRGRVTPRVEEVKPMDQADAALAMALMNDNVVEQTPELVADVKPALAAKGNGVVDVTG